MSEYVLEVTGLNKSFGKKHVLKDVTFNVKPHEIVGFIGPNGAGKSTTMKCICNLIYPDSGSIKVNGYDLFKEREKALAEAKKMGFEEGFMAGKEEGYEETLSFRNNAIAMLEDAEIMSRDYLEANEDKIIHLSTRIAEKIVQETVDTHEDSLMLLARPILQEYGKTENVIVTCHPGMVAFMKCQIPEIKAMCPKAHVLILQDKNLELNDIIIENENQITDLTIKKQIARFIELATQ